MSRSPIAYAGLGILVFASRIPYLGPGFGSDIDAWLTAWAAREILEGDFIVSRPPGHPVHEFISALLWRGGPTVLCGASALICSIACVCLAGLLRGLGLKHWFLGGFALGMVPVVYVSSTWSLDHVWAMALLTLCLLLVMRGWILSAGFMLALAAGCRLPVLIVGLPFAWIVSEWRGLSASRARIVFIVIAVSLTVLVYLPVVLTNGFEVMQVYRPEYPGLMTILYRGTVGVWGVLGFMALIVALVSVWHDGPGVTALTPEQTMVVKSAISGSIVVLAGFLALPLESAYLMPALPLALILLGLTLRPMVFAVLCASIVLSPYVLGVVSASRTVDVFSGPVALAHQRAEQRFDAVMQVARHAQRLPANSVLVCGWWWREMRALGLDLTIAAELIQWLDEPTADAYRKRGWSVYCAPGQAKYNQRETGLRLEPGCEVY